jgi:hypothetical protein
MATLVKIHEDGHEEFKDGGARVEAIKYDNDGIYEGVVGNKPMIGCSLLVGSVTARTYQHQDYWLTTEIVEILEENKKEVVFKTKNSKYRLVW